MVNFGPFSPSYLAASLEGHVFAPRQVLDPLRGLHDLLLGSVSIRLARTGMGILLVFSYNPSHKTTKI